MQSQEKFLAKYDEWYLSAKGAYVLESSLHLTKEMLSPWPRRGHNILAMGYEHWKSLEVLWESGFDVTAIAATKTHIHTAREALQYKVDLLSNSFEHLPFDDESFDYVVIMPPPREESYPSMVNMLNEAHRLATKGVLLQFWNTFSIIGLWRKFQKLPFFLQHNWWLSWRDVHNCLRNIAPKGIIRTGSSLLGPPNTWHEQSFYHKANTRVIPLPLGNLVQIRLSFLDQAPLSGIPLTLDPRQIKGVQPLVAMERQSNNFRK